MLFSENLSHDIFGGIISTYFVDAAVLHLLYLSFRWGVVGLEWVAVMVTVQKKVENHWFSATVSNAQQRQEQSFRTLREKVHIWLGSLHAANFIYCLCDDSLFVYQKILHVYGLKTIFNFFSHAPTIVDEKYFCWKWTHFRKIYQGRLSFFWSWQNFLDTSWLTNILEGTLPSDSTSPNDSFIFCSNFSECSLLGTHGLQKPLHFNFPFVTSHVSKVGNACSGRGFNHY